MSKNKSNKEQDLLIKGAQDDMKAFLEGIHKKSESAQRDILQMGKLFCGLQAIAGVLEYAAQPGSDGTEAFSTEFDINLSQLLEVMGEYGCSLAYGQWEHGGICGATDDLELRIRGMKEGGTDH